MTISPRYLHRIFVTGTKNELNLLQRDILTRRITLETGAYQASPLHSSVARVSEDTLALEVRSETILTAEIGAFSARTGHRVKVVVFDVQPPGVIERVVFDKGTVVERTPHAELKAAVATQGVMRLYAEVPDDDGIDAHAVLEALAFTVEYKNYDPLPPINELGLLGAGYIVNGRRLSANFVDPEDGSNFRFLATALAARYNMVVMRFEIARGTSSDVAVFHRVQTTAWTSIPNADIEDDRRAWRDRLAVHVGDVVFRRIQGQLLRHRVTAVDGSAVEYEMIDAYRPFPQSEEDHA